MRHILVLSLLASLGLMGCSSTMETRAAATGSTTTTTTTGSTTTTTSNPTPSVVISGNVHGGLAPIVGAHVYLLAVGTTGYGAASVSALDSSITGQSDSTGAYVLSDNVGGYSIPTNAITCTSDQMTYLLATGGNAGVGANSAITLLAAYGACPTASSSSTVWINEVSTVGTSYALAAFATDAEHISSSGTAAAKQGVKNAFSVAPNLYTQSVGSALATTPNGNGTAPQQALNTLANMLSACINTSTASAPACLSLFSGASNTAIISDTATAAIAIAHNPAANVSALYALQALGGVTFTPSLAAAPTSLILPVIYTGGGLESPLSLAVDATGSVWVGNGRDGSRNAFSTSGIPLSPVGFADSLTGSELSMAIDTSGDVWAVDSGANGLSEISPTGDVVGSIQQFAAANFSFPLGVAFDKTGMLWVGDNNGVTKLSPTGTVAIKIPIPSSLGDGAGDVKVDGFGNVWVTNFDDNNLIKLSPAGVPAFGIPGVSGNGLDSPEGIAFDSQNNVWIANANGNSISKFSNSGTLLSPNGFTGGGLAGDRFLAVDGNGNVWTPSSNSGVVSAFDTNGNPLSPSGYWAKPGGSGFWGIAIDGSGNVWSTSTDGALVQIVGAAAPVVTPMATASINNMLGTRP